MKKIFTKKSSLLLIAIVTLGTLTMTSCAKKNGFECPNKISIGK